MRQLTFTHFLPISLDEAWDFFSSPTNLEKITPQDMTFEVTSTVPAKVYEGLMITYKVAPMLGIKLNWCTEITHVHGGKYFVDEQRSGPFAIWHHEHHFEAKDGGVLMTDILTYHVGWSIFGQLADALVVKAKVKGIFKFREKALKELFG